MQSPLQEQPGSNPVSTSATENLLNAEAQPMQTEPGAQENKNKPAVPDETAITPDKSPAGQETPETPAGTTVAPPLENEPGVQSGAKVVSREMTAKPSVSTNTAPDAKKNPGSDGQKAKQQIKGGSDGRKYVPSKKAMVDPLKMDMSKSVVLPLTSSQLSLQCIQCHIIFSDHRSKERHLKLSHPAEYEQCILRNALFTCYICDRHFTNSTDLMVHQKAHTEKTPFKCPICTEAFKKSSELTSHKKVHYGQDGYPCTDCGKPCKTMTLLKYHKRMHTGERPYDCKECGKRFHMSNNLRKHMLSHLPEGTRGGAAPRAPQTKSDSTPGVKHPCSVCKATFKTLKTRQQHMKNKHKLAAASNAPSGGPRLKDNTPIITPISISQPSLLQVEPNGPLQKVDANVDTDQIRRLIESLGNVQKVNQVVILGQVPPNAPPIEMQQVSEPAEMINLNLSPPQIDFIGLNQTESKTADLDPSINPMEQTIILEPITPDGQLENFSGLGSQLTVGEHVELALVETEQTEKPQSNLTHQILQQPESDASRVCQNEANDLEQTVILELTPALTPTMELEQQQHETSFCSVLSTDQETLDRTAGQAAVDEQKIPLPDSSHTPSTESQVKSLHSEQKDLSSCSMTLPDSRASSQNETSSKEASNLKKVSLDQVPRFEAQAAQELSEKIMVEGKNTCSEVKDLSAKDESLSILQTKQDPPVSELPINVMSAQELVKVRKRKPARAFFFQGYMHDLVGSIYEEDFQFDAKPAKRQRTKKSCLVVKFGPQSKDKKSKKQKKPTQQPQPVQEELIKNKTPGKKFSEKKVQTQKKGKGKKEKTGGSVVTGGNVKSPSTPAPQVQQIKQNTGKTKIKKQKAAKEGVAHVSEHKTVASHMIKKKKTTKMLGKDQPKNSKTGKGKKSMAKQQAAEKAEEPDSHVNQDSLLLLKGHKQPQLKVYKLDPSKASNQTPETSPQDSKTVSHTGKSAEGKKKGGRSKKSQKALSLLSSLKASHQLPETVATKPKTTRKRKSSSKVETEGVITSKRALECKDCGERFSEVSSLQKHKTTAHIVESPSLTYTNGNIFEGVSRLDLYQLPKEHDKVIGVMNAPTDWDTEPEMVMEDRERSVSFPALIPSPSLPITPQDVEISNYNDRVVSKTEPSLQSLSSLEVPSTLDEINGKEIQPDFLLKSPFLAPIQTRSSEIGEPLTFGENKQEDADMNPISESEVQGTTDEDVKEELLLEVDLVTVGDQNEGDDAVSRADGLNQNEPDQGCGSESGSMNKHSEQVCKKIPEKLLTSQTVSCSTHDVEVKEEEEETLVQRKKETGTSVVTRMDLTSNTCSAGDAEIRNGQSDCQVVFEKHPVFSSLEIPHHGIVTKTRNEPKAINTTPPLVSLPSATSEKSPDEPVVFELESLSTSVDEVMNEGGLQGREDTDRECDQSPGNILERFLTSRHQTTGNMETERSNLRQVLDVVVENRQQILGSQLIKVEENNVDPLRVVTPTCQSSQGTRVQPEPHQSIRSVLVKEESSSMLNDTRAAQDSRRMRWDLEPVRNGTTDISIMESAETTGDSRVTPEFSSNQCIFYPVKEEEREVLLGSAQTSRGSSTPDESGNTIEAADSDEHERRSSSVEHQETLVRGVLSEPGDFTEGQAASDSEGQHPSDIRDFLLQDSEERDASGFEFSEPQLDREAEILAFFNQNNGSSEHLSQTPTNLPTSSSQLQAENRTREPIDYFSKYFGWDTWTEIASCTNELSTLPSPVTSTEVARFVGIHIAMGTLKFPSPRLYWEDLTKVRLISEAMPLTRFLKLTRALKQTSPSGDPANNDVETSQHQGKTSPTSNRLTSHCTSQNSNSSEKDPLWKVQTLLHRFNAGCHSLRQQGDYAVDQFLLPLTVQINENRPSLYCTTLTGFGGLLIHVDLKVDLSDKEDAVEKMVPKGSTAFLCKQELSTPSMLERLLAAGVHAAGRVGGARGQVGDEFVSSDGKLMLRRSYCGFILSTAGNGQRNMVSLIDSFEKAQTLVGLSRELQSLYSTPLTASAPSCWPQAVLWYLTDAALVNSWLLYRQNHRSPSASLTFMAFRLEVSKALILSSSSDTQDSVPPQPPSEKEHTTSETPGPILVEDSPLPDASTRYDGSGHWPEQLADGEGGRCRFGDCQRTSRVLCLKCCVFLCISRNHNCFLNFHNQGSLRKE